jgi:hypothetical protein
MGLFFRGTVTLIIVCLLTLISASIAGATAPQLWYLDGSLHPDISQHGVMEKAINQQSGWAIIPAGSSKIWLAENAAICDVTFPGGSWVAELKLDSSLISVAALDDGYEWEASIGGWNVDTGWYEIVTVTTSTTYWDSGRNVLIVELQTEPATIYEGNYLALSVLNMDSIAHTVITDGRSSLRSPDTDPGYPLPEIATAVMLGLGFFGLV